MLQTLKTFEQLCGTKHPESRSIAEKLYGELTRDILIRHSPLNMPLKVDRVKYQLDEQIVKDSYIHPSLVKKRPENSLNLPQVSEGRQAS